MKTNDWFRLCVTAMLVLLLGLSLPVAAKKKDNFIGLDLSTLPLFAGTSAPPNLLLAVDDSGSMDFEVLFANDDGTLYWNRNTNRFTEASNDGSLLANADFYKGGSNYGYMKYAYLFPNGCNYGSNRGRRTNCSQHYSIPPIPQFGFTRSPDYNKAYFNPGTEYDPWISTNQHDWGNSKPKTAWPDPTTHYEDPVNLTDYIKKSGDYERFQVNRNTHIPDTIGGEPVQVYVANQWIEIPAGGVDSNNYSQYVSDGQGQGNVGFRYFPATFYLKSASELPPDYGYVGPTISGSRPKGEAGPSLTGYEIKRANFVNDKAYTDAIQNFANWFTYYRKRHLATRGGIVAAFDRISGMRAGSCTINDLAFSNKNYEMRKLDDDAQRQTFYNNIFSINYYSGHGTPNRTALDKVGKQLENNKSIITAPCQRNYALLFTDGYNNSTVKGIGKVDDDYGSPFADGVGNTIADIAMKYYKHLDTPDWPDNLLLPQAGCQEDNPDLSLDCETDLHMVTFGVTLGQKGTIFQDKAYPEENSDPYTNPPPWPTNLNSSYGREQIDDLWHATVNTRGALLNATTPVELANAFVGALEKILGQEGSATSVSVNSASLTAESIAYQASFISGAWSGKLKALPLDSTGDAFGDPIWEASEQLSNPEAKHFRAPDDRVILTSCGDGKKIGKPAAFRYFSIEKKCQDQLTADQLAYIRGDRSGERANGGDFRNRNGNILGDIVHSNPLYVGTPNRFRYPQIWDDFRTHGADSNMPENSAVAYKDPQGASFAQGQMANRETMIYVGANDGMLHGFDAKTGEEKLAYVPGAVVDNLAALTTPNYNHQYYVDGSPNSGDVVLDKNGTYQWRTVLVSGLRGGGQSVFALDITDPGDLGDPGDPGDFSEATPEKTVLWEFTDKQLGNVYGQPAIVRLHDGKWAAIFGNGYNSEDESAQLFIVDIATGKLIKRIDTGAGPSVGKKKKKDECDNEDDKKKKKKKDCNEYEGLGSNGLGPVFPVDIDGDFITDYVYAGDLYGNMWQFDLTGEAKGLGKGKGDEKDWGVGHGGKPLFVAMDPAGNRQPITSQPQVGVHPYGKPYGVMVYFGTGKYLETDDRRANPDVQNSFYGIWDLDVFSFKEGNDGDPLFKTDLTDEIPRSRLVEQTILEQRDSNDISYRLVSDNAVQYQTKDNDSDGKRGWFMDLPKGQGEMAVTNGRIEGDTISFSTTIPNTETCAAGGSGFFMLLNSETGGRTEYPAFDLNGDKNFTSDDDTFERGSENITASGMGLDQGVPGEVTHQIDHRNDQAYYLIPASDGSVRRVYTPKPPDVRRSWREIRR